MCPLLQFCFWVLIPTPAAQTLCERTNSAARHAQGLWRNRLTRACFERVVLAYKMRPSGPSETETDLGKEQAEAVALEELVIRNDEGYLREPDLLAE